MVGGLRLAARPTPATMVSGLRLAARPTPATMVSGLRLAVRLPILPACGKRFRAGVRMVI